jgi:hypothetical protein
MAQPQLELPLEQQQAWARMLRQAREPQGLPTLQELQPPVLPSEEPLASARPQPKAQPQQAALAQAQRSLMVQLLEDVQLLGPLGPCWQLQALPREEPQCLHPDAAAARSSVVPAEPVWSVQARSPERRPHWAVSPASAQPEWPHEQRTVEPRQPDGLPLEALPSPLPQPASARELPSGHRQALTPSTGQTWACCRPFVSTSLHCASRQSDMPVLYPPHRIRWSWNVFFSP